MAQQDNTLGAPTEGLGQTVTFASSRQGGVPQAQAGQRGAVRNTLQDGQFRATNQAQFIQPKEDPTFKLLQKMGSAILAPHIEQAQTEQYVKGMQQAAQGQAIGDIVDEQPWYSKVFGTTSVVDGARAFTSHARVQKEVLAVSEMMPELRKQGPEAAQATFTQRLTSIKTGDPATDAMVMQSLTKELPGLLRTQAKEHIVWRKAEFARSRADAIDSSADVIQSLSGTPQGAGRNAGDMVAGVEGGTQTPGDKALADFSFAQTMAKPASMSPEDYDASTTPSVMKMLAQGKLHAYRVFKDSGLATQLSERSQILLENAEARAEHKARNNLPTELAERYSQLRSLANVGDNKEDIAEWVKGKDKLNEDFRRLTGSGEGLISSTEDVSSRTRILDGIAQADARRIAEARREYIAASTDAAKAAAKDAERIQNLGILLSGGSPNMMKPEDVKEAAGIAAAQGKSAEFAKQTYKHGYVDRTYSGRITEELSVVGGDAVQFDKVYREKYLPLIGKTMDGTPDFRAAEEYFNGNPEHSKSMAMYHSMVSNRNLSPSDQGAAHALSIAVRPRDLKTDSKGKLTGDDAVYAKTIDSWATGWVSGKTSLLNFNDGVIAREKKSLLDLAAPIADRLSPVIPADQRMKLALSTMERDGMSMVGGRFIVAPSGQENIKSHVEKLRDTGGILPAIASDEIDEAFRNTVDKMSSERGVADPAITQRMVNGKPTLIAVGSDKDGKFQFFSVTPDDIVKSYKTKVEAERGSPIPGIKRESLQAGPEWRDGGVMAPPSDRPSIYDSEDKWIAWRKLQAANKQK